MQDQLERYSATQLFVWGLRSDGQAGTGKRDLRNENGVERVVLKCKASNVSSGFRHTLVVADGKVFAFGYAKNGRLGIGTDIQRVFSVYTPTLLTSLTTPIRLVSCGFGHSAALSATGTLFVWGYGADGALGLGNDVDVLEPCHVSVFGEPVANVSCGGCHTLVVTASGRLFGCGLAAGVGASMSGKCFVEWKGRDADKITNAHAGHKSSIVFLANHPKSVVVFGSNVGGLLGLSDNSEEGSEVYLDGTMVDVPDMEGVVTQALSTRFGALLDSKGNLFVSGNVFGFGPCWKKLPLDVRISSMAGGVINLVCLSTCGKLLTFRSAAASPVVLESFPSSAPREVYAGYRTFFCIGDGDLKLTHQDSRKILRGRCSTCANCSKYGRDHALEPTHEMRDVCERCGCDAAQHQSYDGSDAGGEQDSKSQGRDALRASLPKLNLPAMLNNVQQETQQQADIAMLSNINNNNNNRKSPRPFGPSPDGPPPPASYTGSQSSRAPLKDPPVSPPVLGSQTTRSPQNKSGDYPVSPRLMAGSQPVSVAPSPRISSGDDRETSSLMSLTGFPLPKSTCLEIIAAYQSQVEYVCAPHVSKMRFFATSDIHTDFRGNMKWLAEFVEWAGDRFQEDAIIVAGDVSHDMVIVEATLRLFKRAFGYVFHTFGNHELWVIPETATIKDGFHKLVELQAMYSRVGVYSHTVVFSEDIESEDALTGVVVCPMLSWYEPAFAGLSKRGVMEGFDAACRFEEHDAELATLFLSFNEEAIAKFLTRVDISESKVITFSHFLPRQELFYGWSALLEVMGSERIDAQLRFAGSSVHVFGHSHLNYDRVIDGVRYVQHALGSTHTQRTESSFPNYKTNPDTWRNRIIIDEKGKEVE